jgi:hypothetical protein
VRASRSRNATGKSARTNELSIHAGGFGHAAFSHPGGFGHFAVAHRKDAVEDLAAIVLGTSSPLAVRRNDCPLFGKLEPVAFRCWPEIDRLIRAVTRPEAAAMP